MSRLTTPHLFRTALAVLLTGTTLLGYRIWSIMRLQFQDATVQSVEKYDGNCRLRMGKYLPCDRYRAKIQFMPPGKLSPVFTTIEAGERAQHLEIRDTVKIMYDLMNPEAAEVASISEGWIGPLSLLVIGGLLFAIASGGERRPAPATALATPKEA